MAHSIPSFELLAVRSIEVRIACGICFLGSIFLLTNLFPHKMHFTYSPINELIPIHMSIKKYSILLSNED